MNKGDFTVFFEYFKLIIIIWLFRKISKQRPIKPNVLLNNISFVLIEIRTRTNQCDCYCARDEVWQFKCPMCEFYCCLVLHLKSWNLTRLKMHFGHFADDGSMIKMCQILIKCVRSNGQIDTNQESMRQLSRVIYPRKRHLRQNVCRESWEKD